MFCWKKRLNFKKKKKEIKKHQKGTFKIGNLYYRKDRIKKPETSLKCISINKNMGWCNDVKFPKIYNKLFTINKKKTRKIKKKRL